MKKTIFIIFILLISSALVFAGCKGDSADILSISVYQPPTKVIYHAGENLDMSGCKILVHTRSGKDYYVDVTNDMVKGFVSKEGNNRVMTISYTVGDTTFSTTQPYTVQKPLATDFTILEYPKTEYVDGDTVDLEKLKASVTFSDGHTADRTGGAFSVVGNTKLTTEDTSITIKIDNVTKNIPVTVVSKEVSGIKVTALPKTEYIEGEYFNATGLKVNYVYNNGDLFNLANVVYSSKPLKESDKKFILTAYYEDKEFQTEIEINVAKRELSSLILNTEKMKKVFVKDSEYDLSGLSATVVCTDTTQITVSRKDLDLYYNGTLLTSETKFEAGVYTIDAYYKYASGSTVHDSFEITVTDKAVVVELRVLTPLSSNEFFEGEEIFFGGLRLYAIYNDGEEIEIVNGSVLAEGVTYTPEYADVDTQEVVITFEGVNYSFPVVIHPDETIYDDSDEYEE